MLCPVFSTFKRSLSLTLVRMSGSPLSPKFPTVALQLSKSSVSEHVGGHIEITWNLCLQYTLYLSIYKKIKNYLLCFQGPVFKAMYDYEAQDDDEVGFQDGDVIVDIETIDEGWMFGTVQRTGKRGMLPANYVEKA